MTTKLSQVLDNPEKSFSRMRELTERGWEMSVVGSLLDLLEGVDMLEDLDLLEAGAKPMTQV